MRRPTETYEQFDVVKVPLPFADKTTNKRRPALILTPAKRFNSKVGASIMAMITSQKSSKRFDWPLDIEIVDLEEAGLPCSSLIRWKLFTLDHRLILGCLGKLSARDRMKAEKQLRYLFSLD
ncbi:MAG: type II toxin-antitoxin system PemK/MazF family toxin [Waddliaceae bacterium]